MGRFRGRRQRRGEGLDRAVDVVRTMGEGHVEFARSLDHAALEHRAGERGVKLAVGGEARAVVGDGSVREVLMVCLDHRFRLAQVIERRDQHPVLDGVWNARRVRCGCRERLGSARGPTLISE